MGLLLGGWLAEGARARGIAVGGAGLIRVGGGAVAGGGTAAETWMDLLHDVVGGGPAEGAAIRGATEVSACVLRAAGGCWTGGRS